MMNDQHRPQATTGPDEDTTHALHRLRHEYLRKVASEAARETVPLDRLAFEYEALGEEYDDLTDQLVQLQHRRLDLHALVWVQRVAIWALTIALVVAVSRQPGRRWRR